MYNSMRDRGHITGLPIYQLLGGNFRDAIPCYVSGLPKPTLEARCALAQEWQSKGFHTVKLALGYGVAEDVANVRAIRQAIGPEGDILLDAHWNYSLSEAAELAAGLHDYRVRFLEAPLLPEDVAGHAALRQKSAIPIALGETERTRYQFRPFIERQAVDILQPDVGRTGITELMHIASLAETWNLKVAPHLSVGLAPCIAASLQVAAALPNFHLLEFQPPVFALANNLLKTPLVCRAGEYQLPSGPGLGIEVDEQCVRDYSGRKVC